MQKRRERDNEENKTKKTVDLVKRIVPAISLLYSGGNAA